MSGSSFRRNTYRLLIAGAVVVTAVTVAGVIRGITHDDPPAKAPLLYNTVEIKDEVAGFKGSHKKISCLDGQESQELKVGGGIYSGRFEARVSDTRERGVQKYVSVSALVPKGSVLTLLIVHAKAREVEKLDPWVLPVSDRVLLSPSAAVNLNGDGVVKVELLPATEEEVITGVGFCIKKTS